MSEKPLIWKMHEEEVVHDIAFSSTGNLARYTDTKSRSESGSIPELSGEQWLESLGWLSSTTFPGCVSRCRPPGACIYPAGSWVLGKWERGFSLVPFEIGSLATAGTLFDRRHSTVLPTCSKKREMEHSLVDGAMRCCSRVAMNAAGSFSSDSFCFAGRQFLVAAKMGKAFICTPHSLLFVPFPTDRMCNAISSPSHHH